MCTVAGQLVLVIGYGIGSDHPKLIPDQQVYPPVGRRNCFLGRLYLGPSLACVSLPKYRTYPMGSNLGKTPESRPQGGPRHTRQTSARAILDPRGCVSGLTRTRTAVVQPYSHENLNLNSKLRPAPVDSSLTAYLVAPSTIRTSIPNRQNGYGLRCW